MLLTRRILLSLFCLFLTMVAHDNQPTILDQLKSFGKSAAITTGGLVVGCWVASKSNNDVTGAVGGALTAIAIDHYCWGGNDDPCIARKVG